MTCAQLHPFDRVPMARIAKSHPAFLRKLNLSALRRNIEAQRQLVNENRAYAAFGGVL